MHGHIRLIGLICMYVLNIRLICMYVLNIYSIHLASLYTKEYKFPVCVFLETVTIVTSLNNIQILWHVTKNSIHNVTKNSIHKRSLALVKRCVLCGQKCLKFLNFSVL